MKTHLPLAVHDLLSGDEWGGGPLLQLSNELARPSAEDVVFNYPWILAFAEKYPCHVPSGFLCADVFLAFDAMMDDKVFQPTPPQTRQTLAIAEGAKMKKLMGGLRYLWRSSVSDHDSDSLQLKRCVGPTGNHPKVTELKSLLQESPKKASFRRVMVVVFCL